MVSMQKIRSLFHSGREWIACYRERLFLLLGVILVGVLAFESGVLRGALMQTEPLVLSIPAETGGVEDADSNDTEAADMKTVPDQPKAVITKCAFVGSRNSDKYHLPSCAVVKRIKPENKVCFASKEDAEKRGYVAGCVQ